MYPRLSFYIATRQARVGVAATGCAAISLGLASHALGTSSPVAREEIFAGLRPFAQRKKPNIWPLRLRVVSCFRSYIEMVYLTKIIANWRAGFALSVEAV